MKIFVTVKQVPDTSGKVAVNPDGTLDRASMQTIINPDDLNAVEAALSLKDELGCKVIAFTMGPPPAEGMLRELMAMGVDEGVLDRPRVRRFRHLRHLPDHRRRHRYLRRGEG